MMKWTYLFLVCSVGMQVQAQKIVPQVMASAGASMKSGNINLEWTLGEMATETLKSTNLTITQGFHQPNLIMVGNFNLSSFNLNVFPNPVTELLIIQNQGEKIIDIQLMDINGKILSSQKLNSGTHELPMNQFPAGTYLLQMHESGAYGHFAIEKIK